MSTTIDESQSFVTLIHVFDVEPDKQGELVDVLERANVDIIRYLNGFISSSIHCGLDGKHVANYAQWSRREDIDVMLAHPEVKERIMVANAIGQSSLAIYRVDSICGK